MNETKPSIKLEAIKAYEKRQQRAKTGEYIPVSERVRDKSFLGRRMIRTVGDVVHAAYDIADRRLKFEDVEMTNEIYGTARLLRLIQYRADSMKSTEPNTPKYTTRELSDFVSYKVQERFMD